MKEDDSMKARYFALPLGVLLLANTSLASAHNGEKLGTVHFPVSCAPAVQADFERAVALLHSFWYEEALKAFTTVTTADPSCAMGWGGSARSVHPPRGPPPSQGRLQRGPAAAEKARPLKAPPREKDYTGATDTYYRKNNKLNPPPPAAAKKKAREQVPRRYPDDRE